MRKLERDILLCAYAYEELGESWVSDLHFDSMCKDALASCSAFATRFKDNLKTCSFRKSDIPNDLVELAKKLSAPTGGDGIYRAPGSNMVRISPGRFIDRPTAKLTLFGKQALLKEQLELEKHEKDDQS